MFVVQTLKDSKATCRREQESGWTPAQRLVTWSRAGIRSIFGNACACKLLMRHTWQLQIRVRNMSFTVKSVWSVTQRQRCDIVHIPTLTRHSTYSHAEGQALYPRWSLPQSNLSQLILWSRTTKPWNICGYLQKCSQRENLIHLPARTL